MDPEGTTCAHVPVLLQPLLAFVAARPGGVYADATVGGGGYAEALLEASAPDGRVVGIDRDPDALAHARARLARFGDRAVLRHAEFAALGRVLAELDIARLDGVVADLGLSSLQLEDAQRGFSFARTGPLDMRMDPTQEETVGSRIARAGERELADLIHELGEERRARRIARSIRQAYERNELETTEDLRRAVTRAVGPRRGRIDPATRTFQALRMAVNDELGQLRTFVGELPVWLEDNGVGVVVSFHSLEDRMVKRAFRDDTRLEPLTKKPVTADDDERRANPRARSAKLRAARRRPRDTHDRRAA